jgi:hypothetical protein
MGYFPILSPIFHHSSIPAFHSDGTNRFPLKDWLFHAVVENPRR